MTKNYSNIVFVGDKLSDNYVDKNTFIKNVVNKNTFTKSLQNFNIYGDIIVCQSNFLKRQLIKYTMLCLKNTSVDHVFILANMNFSNLMHTIPTLYTKITEQYSNATKCVVVFNNNLINNNFAFILHYCSLNKLQLICI
jgi:hypothetical protein